MQLLPLSAVHPNQLDGIFQEEIQHWRNELFWDYEPAVELIRNYLSRGKLTGWILKPEKGGVAGYSYYVVNPPVGYIGNIYVRSGQAGTDIYAKLLAEVLYSFQCSRGVQRIETQMFGFNCDLAPVFLAHGFTATKRFFLISSLEKREAQANARLDLSPYRVLNWENRFFFPAADVIYDAYRGSVDWELCNDYRSREGCVRLLRNLLDNPGFGSFNPRTSYVVSDAMAQLCGILITSRISLNTGMIPQLSVRKDYQGRGLGLLLLRNYFDDARKTGLERITLSVSAGNERACRLYSGLGFEKRKEFYAFVKE